jgi:hypothetical protein
MATFIEATETRDKGKTTVTDGRNSKVQRRRFGGDLGSIRMAKNKSSVITPSGSLEEAGRYRTTMPKNLSR